MSTVAVEPRKSGCDAWNALLEEMGVACPELQIV